MRPPQNFRLTAYKSGRLQIWSPPVSGDQEHTKQIDRVSVISIFPILDNFPAGVHERLVRTVHHACRNEWGRKGRVAIVRQRFPVEFVTGFDVSRITAGAAFNPIGHFVGGCPRLRRPMMSKVCRQPPWVPTSVPGVIAVGLRLKEVWGVRLVRTAGHESG